jgi:hypothetical protein
MSVIVDIVVCLNEILYTVGSSFIGHCRKTETVIWDIQNFCYRLLGYSDLTYGITSVKSEYPCRLNTVAYSAARLREYESRASFV